MYQAIYRALLALTKGDLAELKRCNFAAMANSSSYFRVLAYTKLPDNKQTQRILYLLLHSKIAGEDEGQPIAQALIQAGVKESQVIQLTRSGDNGIEYLKRQLVRCTNINLDSLGRLAQYWGESARRQLLKEYILANTEQLDTDAY